MNQDFNQNNSSLGANNQSLQNNSNTYQQIDNQMNQQQVSVQPINPQIVPPVNIQSTQKTSKSKKTLILIIVFILIFVLLGIGLVFKDKIFNSSSSSSKIEKNLKWKIMVNGKEYKIPTNLTNLTNNGFYYDNYYGELGDSNLDDFTQEFSLNPPEVKIYDKEYVLFPDAGFGGFGSLFDVYLVHKNNSSSDYKNYIIAGFNITNISKDFFSVNGVGCGSTIDDVISALKIDTSDKNFKKETYGKITTISYIDTETDVAIIASTSSSSGDRIFVFQIFINNRDYLKE